MDKRPFTCCFTGHRNLPEALEEEIWRRVYACLELLLEEGVRYFGVGGALGFDTMVAEKLLALRMYAEQRGVSVEEELAQAAEAMYQKVVPANVRAFVDMKVESQKPKRKGKDASVSAVGDRL